MYSVIATRNTGGATHPDQAVVNYFPIGLNNGGKYTTDEASVQISAPASAVLSQLAIRLTTPPGGSASWTWTLRVNGANTALTATISGSNLTVTDNTHRVKINEGDLLSFSITPSGTPALPTNGYTMRVLTEATGQLITAYNLTLSDHFIRWGSVFGGAGTSSSGTEPGQQTIIPVAGTISRLRVATNSPPGGGLNWKYSLVVNGVDSALTATIADSATSAADTTHTVSVAAGDVVDIHSQPSTGTLPDVGVTKHSVLFTPTDGRSSVFGMNIGFTSATALDGSVPTWASPVGTGTGFRFNPTTDPEINLQMMLGAVKIKNLYVSLSTGLSPGSGKSFTLTMNNNFSATPLSAVIANSNTSAQNTTDVVQLQPTDKLSLYSTPAGGPIPRTELKVGWAAEFTKSAGFLGVLNGPR